MLSQRVKTLFQVAVVLAVICFLVGWIFAPWIGQLLALVSITGLRIWYHYAGK